MAVKAGQIIHTGDTVLVQRLQTAGPGNLNIPTQKIAELGNYKSVAVTRDTPDLTFTMESYDVTTAPEALLVKGSSPFDLGKPRPIDIVSQWKAGEDSATPFQVVESVAIPQLALESVSYRFGIRDNATQTYTLRGDSIFYNPGATMVEQFAASGTAGQILAFAHPAGVYNGDTVAGARYALNVSVAGKRLIYGVDYTEQVTGSGAFRTVTVTILAAQTAAATIQVVYFTNDVVEYLQNVHTAHSVKPAAIRGKDITVLFNGVDLTDRLTGVQSVNIDQRFTIQRDEEMGNPNAVTTDYADVPTVNGSMTIRFRDPQEFHARLVEALGIASADEAIGATQSTPRRLDVVLHHPDTGAVLKTLEVPDAVVSLPGYSARVNTKLDLQLNFESETGTLHALAGAPA